MSTSGPNIALIHLKKRLHSFLTDYSDDALMGLFLLFKKQQEGKKNFTKQERFQLEVFTNQLQHIENLDNHICEAKTPGTHLLYDIFNNKIEDVVEEVSCMLDEDDLQAIKEENVFKMDP